MPVIAQPERWRAVAARALAAGATDISVPPEGGRRNPKLDWRIAGNCQSPVWIEYTGAVGRPDKSRRFADLMKRGIVRLRKDGPTMSIEMEVRCRTCAACLKARAAMWRMRATAEIGVAPRTWFGTLTLSPAEQYRTLALARSRADSAVSEWHALKESERFNRHVNAIGTDITLWLKRVRKNSGARLRYLLVAEAHKSGTPHFHMLLHEVIGGGEVRHALLKSWPLGFSHFRLVKDARAAGYLTKYLAKDMLARPRASVDYGRSARLNAPIGHSPVRKGVSKEGSILFQPSLRQDLAGTEPSSQPIIGGGNGECGTKTLNEPLWSE